MALRPLPPSPDKPHAPADLPREGFLQVPLARQPARRPGEYGGRDAAALDGAAEHEDGVAEGALLRHDVVQLVADDGGGDEQVVDGGRLLRLALGDDGVCVLEGGVQRRRVGGQEGAQGGQCRRVVLDVLQAGEHGVALGAEAGE